MNIEELEQIKEDLKAVYNVMYNFDDMLCDNMQVRVKRIETLLTAYEKQNKIIDLMIEHIYTGCDFDNNIKTKEQIREYFEERCK